MEQLRGIELKRFLKKNKKPKSEVYLLLENIQYARNVASIFRTADAMNVKKIFLTGISKTPPFGKDLAKASRHKEKSVLWEYYETSGEIINKMKKQGFLIAGLEITDQSENINQLKAQKILLVLGNETYGIVKNTIARLDKAYFIPMFGKGASLSVGVAGAIALNQINLNNS